MTWRSPTGVVRTVTPASRMASWRPRLLITVQAMVEPLRLPSACMARAHKVSTRSPATVAPVSSVKMTRSASPSNEMPRSAPCSRTAWAACSGCSAPTPALMFKPSGSTPSFVTFAPSSLKISGARRYAAPCPQSTTNFMPLRSVGPRLCFAYSM